MRRARGCSSSAAVSSGRSAAPSWSPRTSSARSPITSRCCATSTSRSPARSTPTGRGRIPTFGSNVQWREMTGSANYKGVDLGFEKRFTNGYSYRASYTHRQQPRQRAGASRRQRRRSSAERPRSRGVGRPEQLRHPPPLRRQFHRRAAVRRGQADAVRRTWQSDSRRLAGERHLQRAHGPAVHGDAGQQQRRHRRHRRAGSHRRSRRAADRRAVVQHRRLHARRVRRIRQLAAETTCADRAG